MSKSKYTRKEWAAMKIAEAGGVSKFSIKSEADLSHALKLAEAGDHRTSLIRSLGAKMVTYHYTWDEEDFRAAARVMRMAVEDGFGKNSTRTRIQAIRSAISPLMEAAKILPNLKRIDSPLARRLELHLLAYYDEIGEDGFEFFGNELKKIVQDPKEPLSNRIIASREAVRTVLHTLSTMCTLHETYKAEQQARLTPAEQERIEANIKQIESEIVQ